MSPVRLAVLEVRRGLSLLSPDRRTRVWPEASHASAARNVQVSCNICGWRGTVFQGTLHSESAACPTCGSISRDRFLFFCWVARTAYEPGTRLLETSPRMPERYRTHMQRIVHYTSSDYDESAHKGSIKLDLQSIDLPDGSFDAILTPHVLEHVPDTSKAIAELYRVLSPGGSVFLQVPIPQGVTGVPSEPEYHGDNTLVHFRFGWDLADMLRRPGFDVTVLVTEDLAQAVANGQLFEYYGDDCDANDIMRGATGVDLTAVATSEQARRHGFHPPFQFITFQCRKP